MTVTHFAQTKSNVYNAMTWYSWPRLWYRRKGEFGTNIPQFTLQTDAVNLFVLKSISKRCDGLTDYGCLFHKEHFSQMDCNRDLHNWLSGLLSIPEPNPKAKLETSPLEGSRSSDTVSMDSCRALRFERLPSWEPGLFLTFNLSLEFNMHHLNCKTVQV